MMARATRAKRIYILIIKEIGNMFSVFPSSYRNTRESLGELEKTMARVLTTFLVLPNFHSCFYLTIRL